MPLRQLLITPGRRVSPAARWLALVAAASMLGCAVAADVPAAAEAIRVQIAAADAIGVHYDATACFAAAAPSKAGPVDARRTAALQDAAAGAMEDRYGSHGKVDRVSHRFDEQTGCLRVRYTVGRRHRH